MRTQCLSFALFLVGNFLDFLILQADDTNIKFILHQKLYRMYKICNKKNKTHKKKPQQQQKDTSEQKKSNKFKIFLLWYSPLVLLFCSLCFLIFQEL